MSEPTTYLDRRCSDRTWQHDAWHQDATFQIPDSPYKSETSEPEENMATRKLIAADFENDFLQAVSKQAYGCRLEEPSKAQVYAMMTPSPTPKTEDDTSDDLLDDKTKDQCPVFGGARAEQFVRIITEDLTENQLGSKTAGAVNFCSESSFEKGFVDMWVAEDPEVDHENPRMSALQDENKRLLNENSRLLGVIEQLQFELRNSNETKDIQLEILKDEIVAKKLKVEQMIDLLEKAEDVLADNVQMKNGKRKSASDLRQAAPQPLGFTRGCTALLKGSFTLIYLALT